MKIFRSVLQEGKWEPALPETNDAQLILAFGSPKLAQNTAYRNALKASFPQANVIGCSTSGEIHDDLILDDSFCISAITWEKTQFEIHSGNIGNYNSSQEAGFELAAQLKPEQLKHVLVFSDGQLVNGSALLHGLQEALPESVTITGGLAGDGDRFQETWVWHNDKVETGLIVVCGLYGEALKVGHGCMGGWDSFGPQRHITKAEGNILYELDGNSALELYKSYLGEHAEKLPSAALLFPLHVSKERDGPGVVRTILNVDEKEQSMIFAGDMQQGAYAQLMNANFDRLIDGANEAASNALVKIEGHQASLALLISCVGRRIVLNQRAEEELEAAQEALHENTPMCGFYSYGEISPLQHGEGCSLHNQTMTITTFSEG